MKVQSTRFESVRISFQQTPVLIEQTDLQVVIADDSRSSFHSRNPSNQVSHLFAKNESGTNGRCVAVTKDSPQYSNYQCQFQRNWHGVLFDTFGVLKASLCVHFLHGNKQRAAHFRSGTSNKAAGPFKVRPPNSRIFFHPNEVAQNGGIRTSCQPLEGARSHGGTHPWLHAPPRLAARCNDNIAGECSESFHVSTTTDALETAKECQYQRRSPAFKVAPFQTTSTPSDNQNDLKR